MYNTNPVLYIIMRTDMKSLNAGKAMAQSAHAANAFMRDMELRKDHTNRLFSLYDGWINQTSQGFGTTIVLQGKNKSKLIWEELDTQGVYTYDQVIDPTYPVCDGGVTHLIDIETCAYLFLDRNDPKNENILKIISEEFELHK